MPFSLATPSSSLATPTGGASPSLPTEYRSLPFSKSDVVFGFENGTIEHRQMDGTLLQVFHSMDGSAVRGLTFGPYGDLFAVLASGRIERFRQIDAASQGRLDTSVTWDGDHIPWDMVVTMNGLAYVIWASAQETGTQHGIYEIDPLAAGGPVILTYMVTASTGYYGAGGEARPLKIDIEPGPDSSYQNVLYYTDNYYTVRFMDLPGGFVGTRLTLDPTLPWQAGGFRRRVADDREIFIAHTEPGAPAGPRNAVTENADGNTGWADEVNVSLDIRDPGVQHADRYVIGDGTHVKRITTTSNNPILSMASWISSAGAVQAVCGDIFVAFRDRITSNMVIGVFDGVTGALKGKLDATQMESGYSACFDSSGNYYISTEFDDSSGPNCGSVWKWAPGGGGFYDTHTRFWKTPDWTGTFPNLVRHFVYSVSVDQSNNVYVLWRTADSATPANDRIHLTIVLPDGTEHDSSEMGTVGGVVGSLQGGAVSKDGTRFYYTLDTSSNMRILVWDVVNKVNLANFLDVPHGDFTFDPNSLRWSNGLLASSNEGTISYTPPDPGISVRRYSKLNSAFSRDFKAIEVDIQFGGDLAFDVAVDFVPKSFVVSSQRSFHTEVDHVAVTRFNVETGVAKLVVSYAGDNFGFLPVAVLCPGELPPLPGPGAERVWISRHV